MMGTAVVGAPYRWHAETLHEIAGLESVDGWSLSAVQTTPGTLACIRREFQTDGLQLLDEDQHRVTVNMYGSAPPGSLVFGVVLRGDADARVNGRSWRPDEMVVGPSVSQFEILLPPTRTATLVVRRDLLAEQLWQRDGVRLDDWASGMHPLLVRTPSLVQSARARLLWLADDLARGLPDTALSAAQGRTVRGEILDVLADVVVGTLGVQRVLMPRSLQAEVVRQARRHVAENAGECLMVEDLCGVTRVSRRSLQRCFTTVLGVTPVEYLRLTRLGNARRLLTQAREGHRIHDVLAKLGIWHASRFAAEYRAHYGELPSATLHRRSRQLVN
jgi:AraC family transcriptional regulator, ethanolamine operon transcriptional activator